MIFIHYKQIQYILYDLNYPENRELRTLKINSKYLLLSQFVYFLLPYRCGFLYGPIKRRPMIMSRLEYFSLLAAIQTDSSYLNFNCARDSLRFIFLPNNVHSYIYGSWNSGYL